MCEQDFESADKGLRIAIKPNLAQYAPTIVVNALTREPSLVIETEDSTEWKAHWSPGGRQTAPRPELRTADLYFECNALLRSQAALDFDVEIGKRREKVLIVTPHRLPPFMVFTPRLIVVPSLLTKGCHDPW